MEIDKDAAVLAEKRRWRQKGLLTAFGIVFSVSAVMRLGSMEFAFAEGRTDAETAQAAHDAAPIVSASTGTADLVAPVQSALDEVLALRATLDAREAELADRETAVAAAQTLVERRLEELAEAEGRLEALISISDSAAETDLDRLTRVYETMAPEEAAPLFEQMSASFAAGFLSRMAPASSAAVMAEMDPESAYAVSVVIATRNVQAPRSDASATDATSAGVNTP